MSVHCNCCSQQHRKKTNMLSNLIQCVKPDHMSVFITFSKDSQIISTNKVAAMQTPTHSKNSFSPKTVDKFQ